MTGIFSRSVTINSEPSKVWTTLTDTKLMSQWLGDPEMNIEVQTDWRINSPIVIRGFLHGNFENRGTILQYEEQKKLIYTQLDSISGLEDEPENYTILEFILTPVKGQTQLTVNIHNFPTLIIRKHMEFYWQTTVFTIKKWAEAGA